MKKLKQRASRPIVLTACTIAVLATFLNSVMREIAAEESKAEATVGKSDSPAADSEPTQTWGDFKVRFLYDGEPPEPVKLKINRDVEAFGGLNLVDESLVVAKDGSLANVVVWLRTPHVPIHPSYDALKEVEATIQSAGGQFTPRVVPCWTAQSLELRNLDPVARNIYAQFRMNDPFNVILKAKSILNRPPPSLGEPVPIQMTCNVHPWMQGWIVVQPHPYIGVSDREGRLEIKNLPAGMPLLFQVWHERSGYVTKVKIQGKETNWPRGRFTKTLNSGVNDLGEIKFAVDALRPVAPPAAARAPASPVPAQQPDVLAPNPNAAGQ